MQQHSVISFVIIVAQRKVIFSIKLHFTVYCFFYGLFSSLLVAVIVVDGYVKSVRSQICLWAGKLKPVLFGAVCFLPLPVIAYSCLMNFRCWLGLKHSPSPEHIIELNLLLILMKTLAEEPCTFLAVPLKGFIVRCLKTHKNHSPQLKSPTSPNRSKNDLDGHFCSGPSWAGEIKDGGNWLSLLLTSFASKPL